MHLTLPCPSPGSLRLATAAALAALLAGNPGHAAASPMPIALPGAVEPVAADRTVPDDVRDTMRAVRLQPGERIVLDGTLAHPAWARAVPHGRFVERDPVAGAVPPQRTEFRVLYDERALYIGVVAHDDDPARIRDPIVRLDQVIRTQDFIVAYVDAIGTRRSAQFFRVNAAGSRGDGLHTAADDSEDFTPDFDWDAAVTRKTPDGGPGWTAVLRIPFESLRYAPGDHAWRVMVGRRLPREQFHLITSVPIPRGVASFIDHMPPLLGVSIPEDSQFLTVRPGITARRETVQPAGAPRRSDNGVEASLDVKWRPRAELVIDGTLNPDFSQVALDVPQLAGNSRFALSFPEKRPFFFESADLLRSPTEALYTRSFTQPRWGLRATWRSPQWAGTAFVIDDEGEGSVLVPGAYGTDVVDQPASRSLVARARTDGGTLQWGGIAVARRYADGHGDNIVLGPDMEWAVGGGWRMRAQWLHSSSSAQPDSQGGLSEAPRRQGDFVRVRGYYNTADVEAHVGVDDIGVDFRHDSGFVAQAGVRAWDAWYARLVGSPGPFTELWVNFEGRHVTDRSGGSGAGDTVESYWRPGLWARGAHNLEWSLDLYPHAVQRTAPGERGLVQRYASTSVTVTPARWFPLLESRLDLGRFADTADDRVRPGGNTRVMARLRPLARLELEATVSADWLRHGGHQVFRETAGQLLAVWHFDASQTLRLVSQRTSLERRTEANEKRFGLRGATDSLTYAWRASSGTQLYIGASRDHHGPDDGPRDATREVFVKLQVDVAEIRGRLWGAQRAVAGPM